MTGQPPLLDALTGDDEIAALFTDEADLRAMLRAEAALAEAEAEAEAGLVTTEAGRPTSPSSAAPSSRTALTLVDSLTFT